jgi:hypothetical protein
MNRACRPWSSYGELRADDAALQAEVARLKL